MKTNYCPLYNLKFKFGPYTVYDKCVSLGAEVYLAYNSDMDKECCVKIIQIQDEEDFKKQYRNHESIYEITHQNLIRIYHVIGYKNQLWIFQEICHQGELSYNIFNKTTQKSFLNNILDFILQISNGYLELIKKDIIHRDLKPQNILIKHDLKENKLIYKICDFGICKTESSQRKQTPMYQGTPAYSAPEIAEYKWSHEADAFSFGLILFEILIQNTINKSFKHQLIQFLKQYRLKQWFEQGQKQEQFQKDYGKLIVLNELKKSDSLIDPFLLDILNDLLVYELKQRISWDQLNFQVQTKQQELNQNKPIVQFNPQYFLHQPIAENSRLSQSLVTQINKNPQIQINQQNSTNCNIFPNQQQKLIVQKVQINSSSQANFNVQNAQQINSPTTPRYYNNGQQQSQVNNQQQSPAPLNYVANSGNPQIIQKK